jgi:hypothetical protein
MLADRAGGEPMDRRLLRLACAAAVTFATSAQAPATTQQLPADLHLLVGHRVKVGRLPLCEPGTYNANLTVGGKFATVLSFKDSSSTPALPSTVRGRMSPSALKMIDDARNSGMMLFKFDDGSQLDTCGKLLVSQLTDGLELAPGESVEIPAATAAQPEFLSKSIEPQISPNQTCPVVVTKVVSGVSLGHLLLEALFVSRFEQELDRAAHGGQGKHYLDIGIANHSDLAIAGVEIIASYSNNMGDETASATYVSPNSDPIKSGGTFTYSAMDRRQSSSTVVGDIAVSINRVRFVDGTFWKDNGSHSCFNTSKID